MKEPTHVVALSGGKDSTALALRLMEVEPRDYIFFCTPTGSELPELLDHWEKLEGLLGKPITYVRNGTLIGLIEKWNALPNHRQRWCTRALKIEPCLAFLARISPAVLHVGLRADEMTREGIYGITERYPLREWGWGLREVLDYLKERGVTVPKRTDCDRCYGQRISEWFSLWKNHPVRYEDARQQELKTGHTFRSPTRDTWPASLTDLAEEFKRGRKIRGMDRVDENEEGGACRACTL